MDEAKETSQGSDLTIETPWEQATGNQRSRRQERRLAAEPGARAQPNSGRTHLGHRDVRMHGYLVEARTTQKASITVSRDEFLTILRQATSTPPGSLPAMQIDFEMPQGETLSLWLERKSDHDYWQERIALLETELKAARAANID